MDKDFVIGIPIRDFDQPMTRLSNDLSKENRVSLLKSMLENLIRCFEDNFIDIFCITKDPLVIDYCKKINTKTFVSSFTGLSNEVSDFINVNNKYSAWTICHADLPYVTKYYAKYWVKECFENDILISESKDSGTPILGGKIFIKEFKYGENSYKKHVDFFNSENIAYKKIFNKELSFEVDDLDDYKELIKNQPRWYRNIKND